MTIRDRLNSYIGRGGVVIAVAALALLSAGAQAAGGDRPQAGRAQPPNTTMRSDVRVGAKLEFSTIAHMPAPTKAGDTLMVSPTIVNKGQAPSGSSIKFSMTCSIITGPACPIASTTAALPSIPANGSKSLTYVSASQAKAGKYKISFAILNAMNQAIATRDLEINVAGGTIKLPPGGAIPKP